MAHFRYQALNAQQQPVVGELHAESVSQALAQLEADGLTVQSIGYAKAESESVAAHRTSESAARSTSARRSASADTRVEQAILEGHMEKVLERGRALVPALRAYAEEMTSGPRRRHLFAVLRILERGTAAEAAIALRALPAYWIPLLSAAGSSRDPGRILHAFLNESRRADELRRQWWLTLAYPLFVACLAAAVMTLISFLVVPIFRDIFAGFGLRLPPFTQLVLTLSAWITSGRMVAVAALLAALGVLLLWAGRLMPARVRDWLSDRLGTPLGRSTAIARFSQFTADLLEAELDLSNALKLAGIATSSPRVHRAAWRLAHDIESGGEIAPQKYQQPLTATVLFALRSNMSTASRVRLLREVGCCYAQRAHDRFSWTRGVIEPIAICLIGILVGATVVALFLPLFSLIQGLS